MTIPGQADPQSLNPIKLQVLNSRKSGTQPLLAISRSAVVAACGLLRAHVVHALLHILGLA